MKVAVVYYSLEGNTKKVAMKISEKFGADIYELKEVNSKVNKNKFTKYIWGGKQVVMKDKPVLEEVDIKIDEYDCIFFGTPVWAGTFTPVIRSFLSKYSVTNKKVGVFCCHSGGIGNTLQDMKDILVGNTFIAEIDVIDPIKNEVESNNKIEMFLNNININ